MATGKDLILPNDKGEFPQNILPEPQDIARSANYFKLVEAGTGRPMIIDSKYWCYLGAKHEKPVVFNKFDSGNVLYLAAVEQPNYFLSVSRNQYLGLYKWNGATGWTMQPHPGDGSAIELTSDYHGHQAVGIHDNYGNALLAWRAATSVKWKLEWV